MSTGNDKRPSVVEAAKTLAYDTSRHTQAMDLVDDYYRKSVYVLLLVS